MAFSGLIIKQAVSAFVRLLKRGYVTLSHLLTQLKQVTVEYKTAILFILNSVLIMI